MEDYDRIFDEIHHPCVGICVDTGHFHSAKVDTIGLIEKYHNRIYDVHLKDHIGTQSVAIGHGEVDLPAIFSALKEIVYESTITLELLERKSDGEALVGWVMSSLNQFAGCWRSALLEDFVCHNNLTQHSFSHRFCALTWSWKLRMWRMRQVMWKKHTSIYRR
jgi:L-ribulose-5-phosphate 3-epimerase UlaE